jgi:hypothetical protein
MNRRHTLVSLAAVAAMSVATLAAADNPDRSFSWTEYVAGTASSAWQAPSAFNNGPAGRRGFGNPQHSFEWSQVLRDHRQEADIAAYGMPSAMAADEGRDAPN